MTFKQVALGFAVLLLASAIMVQAGDREAYIKSMIGSVKVRKGESPIWKDGQPNMVLKEKDAVRTYIESQVEIMTAEGSILRLDENTTLEMTTLKQFGGGAQTSKIRILNGTVLANIKKLVNSGSKFEFETPTAVASIRGTTVGFDVTSEKTLIKVYDGEVMVTPKGAQTGVSIKTNQMTTIIRGQKIAKSETLTEKEKAAVPPGMVPPAAAPVDSMRKDTTKAAARADSAAAAKRMQDSLQRTKPKIDTVGSAKPPADTSKQQPLRLTLLMPQENMSMRPGMQIVVAGKVIPPTAKVSVAGASVAPTSGGDFKMALTAPKNPGDYEITVEASNGVQSQSMVRHYTVISAAELFLNVTKPAEGERFGIPQIPVSGTTVPGAEVTAGSINCQVAANGSFSGQVPIPDEETEFDLVIEASYNGKTAKVTRRIMYRAELMLSITSPQNGQVFTTTLIPVSGKILPSTAELMVYDNKIQLSKANGNFSSSIKIPDEEGQVSINFEVTAAAGTNSEVTKNETRTITYKKPLDEIRPEVLPGSLPQISKTPLVPFTVLDRTPDDEITFYKITDGSRESETGRPNSSFNLDLEEGFHTYMVYAEDKNRNRSNTVSGTVGYISRSLTIKMRKPIGTEIIRIPPGTPGGDFEPQYTVQFTILNVPDNDRRLIKQVTVTNLATGQTVTQRDLLDLELEFDINLKRGQNRLSVDVRDISDRIFSVKDIMVDVR
jgi:hypothetical protein